MEEISTRPMDGRIVLITGANSGIGKETTVGLAKLGATVVMVCRDRTMGEEANKDIIERTGNKNVELMIVDLSSLDEVKGLAEEFMKRHDRLHVLINNAGRINFQRSVTKEGYETTFGVNHLAHFLVTNLLLDLIKKSAPSRIINVSSSAHRFGKLDFDDLFFEKRYSAMAAYGRSKLANLLFTYELARQLEGTKVTVNALHPGYVNTRFGKSGTGILKAGISFTSRFGLSPQKGAQTSIYLASSPEVEGVSGKYFVKKRPKQSNKRSYDMVVAKRLWEVSEKLVAKQMPKVVKDGP